MCYAGTTCEWLGRRPGRKLRGKAGPTHDMQSFPKAAKGTWAGRHLRNSGDMWIACVLYDRAQGGMAAKPRSNDMPKRFP